MPVAEALTRPARLPFTPQVEARTAPIYAKLKDMIPSVEWQLFAPEIDAINRLKRERNAIVLAHNYQSPEIFHGVADIVGDSLALAREAAKSDADVIVLAGVHFMAETAKLVNPEKTVLMPDMEAGCSLASSITGQDVRDLKAKYPGVPVVTYVNTSAEVKAESDICCTSGNVIKVIESLGVPRVLCIPDEYLAHYVSTKTDVEILTWKGKCEVHQEFSGEDIQTFRDTMDDVVVVAHPECPPDVIAAADFAGSTAEMTDYVRTQKPPRVLLLTECSMSSNIAAELPEVEFVKSCGLCPHMKRITLGKIRRALETMQPVVEVDPDVAARARAAVERMLAVV
ncbi:MAG: quinolinate synthase NadA [Alphaproteobacteria bacterium]|nr:quinolinate synthase NadA [Alphaproteobacteria bacterium]